MNWKNSIAQFLIRFGYRILGVNMLDENHKLIGINLGTSFADSSEKKILESVITKNLSKSELVLDIGANVGAYSKLLCSYFNSDNVLSFEPNMMCRTHLEKNLSNPIFYTAIGKETGLTSFYIHEGDPISTHASIKASSLKIIDKAVNEREVEVSRLDDFVRKQGLPIPSFVKIDTEGNDLDVIIGMGELLNQVKFIQFEFNHQYIYNRIFLQDFYTILEQFDIYRIGGKGLIDLRIYSPFYEIFKYQNLLAVNKNLDLDIPVEF